MSGLCRAVLLQFLISLSIGIIESIALEDGLGVAYRRNESYKELLFVVSIESKNLINYDHEKTYRTGTGSLISKQWVLTSSYVAELMPPERRHIRYGSCKAPKNASNTFTNILLQVTHPTYRDLGRYGELILFNDIALMKVEPVPVETFISLSAVDYMSTLGHKVTMAGFERINCLKAKKGFNLLFSRQIAEGSVTKCEKFELYNGSPYMCVQSKCNKNEQAALEEMGGPLLHRGKQVGVASYRFVFKGYVQESRYTPLSPFYHWIRYVLSSNQS